MHYLKKKLEKRKILFKKKSVFLLISTQTKRQRYNYLNNFTTRELGKFSLGMLLLNTKSMIS